MTIHTRFHQLLALLATAALLAGCASVKVHKVDRATGQVVANSAEGLRFYLPRPYISVFEPFIVASEVYLARGEMSPDSSHVLLTEVPRGLAEIVAQGGGTTGMGRLLSIDAARVQVAPSVTGGAQSAAAPATSAASAPAAAASAARPVVAGGVLNVKATNDNSAFAVTPQPRYFNILWLPDFDEQYVVSAKAGLGNAGVVLGFGQGWSLQALEATVDNSALAKPLLDFYSGTLGALQKLATAKIEAPLAALTGGGGAGAQSAAATATTFAGGTPVTLKVTRVRIVAPGLYPVLKPGEASGLKLDEAQARRILAPVPPLTNIAFNTYDVVVIEAARGTGDSALRIQQYVDVTTPSGGGGGSAVKPPAPANDTPATGDSGALFERAVRKLNVELGKPAQISRDRVGFRATLARDAASGNPVLSFTKVANAPAGDRAAPMSADELKALALPLLKTEGVVVADGNVRF
jgi:hypothetical protein